MQMKHQQQRHSNVKYYTLKKSRPHNNGNGNGYNYNSCTRMHIIQTLPLPLSSLFSSELFLTTKVKMSRRNQTFYRCKFMKSQKPRTQKIKIKPKNWKLRLRNLIDSGKIIFKFKIHDFISVFGHYIYILSIAFHFSRRMKIFHMT